MAGLSALLAWRQMQTSSLPRWLAAVLVGTFFGAPGLVFAAGMDGSDLLALLLLVGAWRQYTRFAYRGVTWSGFIAGLLLGLAFFASYLTLVFVIPFALAAPLHLSRREDGALAAEGRSHAIIAGVAVIATPGAFALLSWLYMQWVTGIPFRLPSSTGSLSFGIDHLSSFFDIVRSLGVDLIRVPLYVVVGVLVARRGTRQTVAYLFPLMFAALVRVGSPNHHEGLIVLCYLLFALLALPAIAATNRPGIRSIRLGPGLCTVLAFASILQIAAALVFPVQVSDGHAWYASITQSDNTTLAGNELQQ